MKQARWRVLERFVRLNVNTQWKKAMNVYFEKPRNERKFPGRKRIIFPVATRDDIKECTHSNLPVSTHGTNEDLKILRALASDKKKMESFQVKFVL